MVTELYRNIDEFNLDHSNLKVAIFMAKALPGYISNQKVYAYDKHYDERDEVVNWYSCFSCNDNRIWVVGGGFLTFMQDSAGSVNIP